MNFLERVYRALDEKEKHHMHDISLRVEPEEYIRQCGIIWAIRDIRSEIKELEARLLQED